MPKKITPKKTLAIISKESQIPLRELQAANPGVMTVKTGQVIKLPKLSDQLGGGTATNAHVPTARELDIQQARNQLERPIAVAANNQSYGNTPTGSFLAGGGALALGNASSGGLSPDERGDERNVVRSVVVPTGSFVSGSGAVNVPRPSVNQQANFQTPTTSGFMTNRPAVSSGSFISGSGQVNTGGQGTAANQPSVQLTSPRPVNPDGSTPVFTGDPKDPNTAKWRAYWNNVSALGGDPNIPSAAPVVMTREEIWNMKAAVRRRSENADSNTPQIPAAYQFSEQSQSYIPEPLARSITWGV